MTWSHTVGVFLILRERRQMSPANRNDRSLKNCLQIPRTYVIRGRIVFNHSCPPNPALEQTQGHKNLYELYTGTEGLPGPYLSLPQNLMSLKKGRGPVDLTLTITDTRSEIILFWVYRITRVSVSQP